MTQYPDILAHVHADPRPPRIDGASQAEVAMSAPRSSLGEDDYRLRQNGNRHDPQPEVGAQII
jgi:hypothetical protein